LSSSPPLGDTSPHSWPLEPVVPGREPVWILGPPPRSAWQRWGRNLVLFLLTALSVFLVGSSTLVTAPGRGTFLFFNVGSGLRLMVGLLAILTSHEMGHYLACRYYRVDATLPFFIPFPSLVGTLGAFIRIRAPIPNRRALFDIGVAGPLAGFVVALPVLWLGILEARPAPFDPSNGNLYLGDPLLFQWISHLIHGALPDDVTLSVGSLGLAAWFGLFVTALNLIPIGQLDGGHVTYAVLRHRAHRISQIGWWVCVALIYFGPNWILWAILLRFLGRRHPPTLDDSAPIGRGRVIVAVISLLIFVVCFVPDPIIFSWRDFFDAVGLGHLLGR
jgi:membrane-associated protease RseP (regulator of RpoE activity)